MCTFHVVGMQKPAYRPLFSKHCFVLAVTILEVRGGTDKGPDGHRRDSGPLLDAFQKRGWNASIEFYTDAYISRVNPGQYENYTESLYFDMCRQLARCRAH